MGNSTVEAVALTAATTVILYGICFYFFYRYVMAKKTRIDHLSLKVGREDTIMDGRERGGALKGVLIEENGLEVLYFRDVEGGRLRTCVWNSLEEEEKRVDSRFDDHRTLKPDTIGFSSQQTKTIPETSPPPPSLKMKPFHWDKVNTEADHSVVWNEIIDGSLRFDDELIEALFGYNASKRNSNEAKHLSPKFGSSSNSTPSAQISILDPRKSQNTAIVLKSLATSHKEILDALSEGRGLNADVLEKLTKISPTEEEASKILQFTGNPTKLPDAESFLYHILKAIPTAFTRINAMLFRLNYDPEILHLNESLQTLELGCKELRAPGIFLKLLEAILRAGNRMNAGTVRGDAKGFNLSALRKLSYVKSIDGKTSLLYFVVEQVVRAEGKRRCMNNRNPRRDNQDSDIMVAKHERDRQYLMLGLPVLGGLSTDFCNVKKAAIVHYDCLMSMSPNLLKQVTEIREMVTQSGGGGFVKEMKEFLEGCEEELKVVRNEQTRVMELVKKTRGFYQIGSNSMEKGEHPLQIFGFVKDFLDMVDQVCLDLTRKVQKKNVKSVEPSSPSIRTPPSCCVNALSFNPSILVIPFNNAIAMAKAD
ncbi:Actin-binding FH2, partial [Cynara cardunculus var. scolymus]